MRQQQKCSPENHSSYRQGRSQEFFKGVARQGQAISLWWHRNVRAAFLYCQTVEAVGANDTTMTPRTEMFGELVVKNILIGQHTCPKNAMKEIEALYKVFQAVRKKWKIENVMFLGNLNAACNYVTNKALKNLCLRSDPKFHWLIRDEQDTSVHNRTHCTYDRIIIHGKELISGTVPESAQLFNFKQELSLSEE
ncbi:deoxyribonuclease I-like 1-like [Xyrauchen texanus]|uniref:deoxyribonuclease I-like 1-like n=1 Tax=Xyrauchen texanus TaxID=154827 RepID=UPI0022421ECB|nr:deoxyribonuclease I-like 1-like [Xyrauchen texanus]